MVLMSRKRKFVREVSGSPEFIYPNSSGTNHLANCETTNPTGATAQAVRKYLPANWYKIINKSGQTVTFYRNQDISQIQKIPDNTVSIVSGKAIHSFRYTTATSISANTVFISIKREEMTGDKFFRDASKNVFVKALLGV